MTTRKMEGDEKMVALIQNMESFGLGASEITLARTVVKKTTNWLLQVERDERREERQNRKFSQLEKEEDTIKNNPEEIDAIYEEEDEFEMV